MNCFGRLVAVLLGQSAVAIQKQAFGKALEILGVDITLGKAGFRCRPAKSKKEKWIRILSKILVEKILLPGQFLVHRNHAFRIHFGKEMPASWLGNCRGAEQRRFVS